MRTATATRVGIALAIIAAALPAAASASFPGRNGKLAVVLEGCPDGDAAEAPRYIRAYSPSGRDLGRLTDCRVNRYGPEWSPRGTRLAFTQSVDESSAFWWIAANGSDLRTMNVRAENDPFEMEGPSFSPNGRRVVFTRGDSIWTARVGGGGLRRLLRRPCERCLDIATPRWSPDGRRIAFAATGAGKRGFRAGVWVMTAKGKKRRRVARGGHEPDWSPDGGRLVFRSAYERRAGGGAEGGNLYVVRPNGKGRRRILRTRDDAATVPVWSPDGRSIAYVSLGFRSGHLGFSVTSRLMRVNLRTRSRKVVARLDPPAVEEGYFAAPDIAWQAKR